MCVRACAPRNRQRDLFVRGSLVRVCSYMCVRECACAVRACFPALLCLPFAVADTEATAKSVIAKEYLSSVLSPEKDGDNVKEQQARKEGWS